MEKVDVGKGNVDVAYVDELSASELLRSVEATSSMSYVTMRKNKKSNKNVVDAEQVEKTIGSLGAELNTNATNHGINVEPIPHVSSSLHDSGVESSLKKVVGRSAMISSEVVGRSATISSEVVGRSATISSEEEESEF
ncbi:hypothetical protein CTI12_AA242720 [Artemisia annua]|uniref:Uncharacterized protein n=1 Tax=Artemisia annua TaxID=35608 RepID=A0A2U1NP22_ARTAN|nr:hypothetical protein CTI12_AA242720 [Artemisia annua]